MSLECLLVRPAAWAGVSGSPSASHSISSEISYGTSSASGPV
ncbi:hypothetical protein AB0A95_16355 [Micromonospora sp. NPDC049230]